MRPMRAIIITIGPRACRMNIGPIRPRPPKSSSSSNMDGPLPRHRWADVA